MLIAPQYDGEPDEAGITRLPSWRVPMDPEDRFVLPSRFRQAAMAAARDCDVVHIQTPFCAHGAGMSVARAFNLPVTASYHTLFEEYLHHYAKGVPSSWLKGLARRISRSQCNGLDAVIVPSSPMADRLREYGVTRPMHVLPTGIPLSRFHAGQRSRFRAHYDIADDRPVALYVGRAAHEKNIDFLIDVLRTALSSTPDLLLLIAGEGPALDHLKDRVQSLGLNDSARFVGYLDRTTELPDCYAAADAFVFASRTETQGLVLLEAMAAGLPVIAIAEMGTRDILTPESGAIAPPMHVETFASEVVRVMRNPQLREEMRAKGLAWANQWSDSALTGRLAELYRSLLASRSTASAGTTATAAQH
ncbi:MAG: glycosyltransferase [Rhodocyclaceae bacterium]